MQSEKRALRRDGASWHEVSAAQIATPAPHRGEIDCIHRILYDDLPVVAAGIEFIPLCKEFPGGSGIDMILLGEDGHLLLTECKNSGAACWPRLQNQALHRGIQYRERTLEALLCYVEQRETERRGN